MGEIQKSYGFNHNFCAGLEQIQKHPHLQHHMELQQIAFYDYFRINRIVKNAISR